MCLQTPPNDSKIPHLVYTNKATSIHINFVFQKTIGQTFILKVINIYQDPMPSTYNLPNDSTKTIRLHNILWI